MPPERAGENPEFPARHSLLSFLFSCYFPGGNFWDSLVFSLTETLGILPQETPACGNNGCPVLLGELTNERFRNILRKPEAQRFPNP
jgi:hypothetical protein